MCGVAGIINFSQKAVGRDAINSMLEKIKHRGPDDEGVFVKDNIGLGHVRLSIIDLTKAGHQPMFSNDGRYCIVFNGEIYNYLELKAEIGDRYSFRSKTDTEVILAAYGLWGESCLSKFNGDFAFVMYDQQEKTFFGARDRFGIKPLYYYLDKDKFAFASEIKGLIPVMQNLLPNNKSIFEFLIYNRVDQSEETFFDSVFKLKHGHCFTIKNDKVEIKRWYNLSEHLNYPAKLSPEEYREELKKSVSLRLRSDVPIGVCLSGGIDSSAITSILFHDFNIRDLQTFSSVFEKGSRFDESPYINTYKDQLKNMWFTTPSGESFYEEFKSFIASHSEPIPGVSPYAQYKVMQLAHGKVSVTLDGQGADEMLGGYTYFFGSYFKELLRGFRWASLLKEASAYYRSNKSKEAYTYLVYYLLPVRLKKYVGRKTFGSVSSEFYHRYDKTSTISTDLYNPESLHESFLQHFEFKLEHLLKWGDLNSMTFSIESRVPFLDHNLVEKTLSLPSNLLLKDGISKYILRESVKDILPSQIYNRKDKNGFEAPSDDWFRTKFFREYIVDLLDSSGFRNRGYFDVQDCKRKFQRHLEQKGNLSKEIWKWMNLELWFQKFIDK